MTEQHRHLRLVPPLPPEQPPSKRESMMRHPAYQHMMQRALDENAQRPVKGQHPGEIELR